MPPLPGMTPGEWAASPWVQAPAALILWIVAFLVVRTLVLGGMRKVAARTPWTWDDILVESLSTPLLIAIVASGLLVFDRILPLAPEWDRAFDVLFAFSIALALVLLVDRTARAVLDRLAAASPVLQGARGHHGSDLDLVERVTLEVARDVMRTVTGGVARFEPGLRFQGFGDSAILLLVVLRAREFEAVQTVRHEFVKRLQAHYRREGIVIPYPIRTLDFAAGHTGGLMEVFGPGPAPPARGGTGGGRV